MCQSLLEVCLSTSGMTYAPSSFATRNQYESLSKLGTPVQVVLLLVPLPHFRDPYELTKPVPSPYDAIGSFYSSIISMQRNACVPSRSVPAVYIRESWQGDSVTPCPAQKASRLLEGTAMCQLASASKISALPSNLPKRKRFAQNFKCPAPFPNLGGFLLPF